MIEYETTIYVRKHPKTELPEIEVGEHQHMTYSHVIITTEPTSNKSMNKSS